jgi:elongation factor G
MPSARRSPLADPQLMEPIQEIEVRVPADLMGDVMTDLQGRAAS